MRESDLETILQTVLSIFCCQRHNDNEIRAISVAYEILSPC